MLLQQHTKQHMTEGYAKNEFLLQALESALEFAKALLEKNHQPENTQGSVILCLLDEIGNQIDFTRLDSDNNCH